MPNKSSKAGHVPQRSCVICKTKQDKVQLFRFVLQHKEVVFDLQKTLPGRGYYLCDDNSCLLKLDKWLKRKCKK